MATVSSETKVVLSMGQFLTLLGSGLAMAIVVLGAAIYQIDRAAAPLQQSLVRIDANISSLQANDRDNAVKLVNATSTVEREVAGLRVDLAGYHGDSKDVQTSVASISSKVEDIQRRLIANNISEQDSKAVDQFVGSLVKAGFEKDKVVVVPFGAKFQ